MKKINKWYVHLPIFTGLFLIIGVACVNSSSVKKETEIMSSENLKISFDGPQEKKNEAINFINQSLKKHGKLGAAIGDISTGLEPMTQHSNIMITDKKDGYHVGSYAMEYELTFNVNKKSGELSNVSLASVAPEPIDEDDPSENNDRLEVGLSQKEILKIPVLKKFMELRKKNDSVRIEDKGDQYEAIVNHARQEEFTGGAEQYFIDKKTGDVKMGWHEHPMKLPKIEKLEIQKEKDKND